MGLLLVILNDQLSLATHGTLARKRASSIPEGRPDIECLSWFAVSRAVVLLFCGTLIVSCAQAPPEPAPEFTLPLSQVTTAPPSPKQAAETASAPSRLRYVGVPPGHQVAGMARARIVKQKATWHRSHRSRKKAVAPSATVKTPTGSAELTSKP